MRKGKEMYMGECAEGWVARVWGETNQTPGVVRGGVEGGATKKFLEEA